MICQRCRAVGRDAKIKIKGVKTQTPVNNTVVQEAYCSYGHKLTITTRNGNQDTETYED
jgi:hypothetical protein